MTSQVLDTSRKRAAAALDGAAAHACGAVPIAIEDDDVLLVGLAGASGPGVVGALNALTGMKVRAVSMSAEQIAAAQREVYGAEVGERERGRALAEEAGVPFVSLARRDDGSDPVNPAAARLLAEEFCRRFEMVAVAAENGVVVLATARSPDADAVQAASSTTGFEALVVVATPGDVEEAIGRAFATTAAPPTIAPPAPAPPEVAEPEVADVEVAPLEVTQAPVAPPRPEPPGERRRVGRRMLGEMLLDSGALDEEGLERALRMQERTGDPLGEILVHSGAVPEDRLAATLAMQLELPLARIDPTELDSEAAKMVRHELMIRHRVVPIAIEEGHLVVAMVDPLDEGTLADLDEHKTLPLRPVLATDTDIDRAIQAIVAPQQVERAATELMLQMPEASAHRVLSQGQKVAFVALLIAGLAGLVIDPLATIIAFNVCSIAFYLASSIYRFRLISASLAHHLELPTTVGDVEGLDEHDLPVYTILVPLYREAAVIRRLTASLAKLDYPATRLDIKLLMEEDDEETQAAVRTANLPPHFTPVIVPDVGPRTKPKACNFGLAQARGELVVIYDAEDRPEPDQLKKIVAAFRKTNETVACIQCKLNYYNKRQNVLTRWFTSEYSMWFDLMLPGLDASAAPIPLGGTSNHFSTARLIELGAWDPFNVTEDADLGIRLHKSGFKTAIIDSTTYEEATSHIPNWVRQRSRWVKGYIQTWLVQMRHPIRLMREIGLRNWLSFQMTVGGTPAIFLLNPIYWTLTTVWLFTEAGVIEASFPGPIYYVAGLGLYVGNFLFAYMTATGASHRGYHDLVKYALLAPVYWGLMSLGAWKGLIQLFTKPFYWEKTVHGLHVEENGVADAGAAAAPR